MRIACGLVTIQSSGNDDCVMLSGTQASCLGFQELKATQLRLCAAVVIEREGLFFLIRRAQKPFIGSWSPVTGEVEPGESVAQAAVREAQEELGLTVEAEREFFVCTSADGSSELHFVLARWVDGDPVPDPREVLSWCSVSFEEMCSLDLFKTDQAAFRRLSVGDRDEAKVDTDSTS